MNLAKEKLLQSVLSAIPEEGWTEYALRRAAQELRVSNDAVKQIFPNGIKDVANDFHAQIDRRMLDRFKARRHAARLRVRDKITLMLRARLEALASHRDAARRLAVWSLLPQNMPQAAKELWRSADSVWLAAGDTSTDYNYYSKRALLAGVMQATFAFWLNDASADYAETWAFLDRRIADILRMGKGIQILKTVGLSDLFSLVGARLKTAL